MIFVILVQHTCSEPSFILKRKISLFILCYHICVSIFLYLICNLLLLTCLFCYFQYLSYIIVSNFILRHQKLQRLGAELNTANIQGLGRESTAAAEGFCIEIAACFCRNVKQIDKKDNKQECMFSSYKYIRHNL